MLTEFMKRLISSIILIPIVFFCIIKSPIFFYFLLITSCFISLYEWNLLVKNYFYKIFGSIFLFFSFYSMYLLRINDDNLYIDLIIILLICIFTDIGGYLFGKIFKGPKLTSYSPNKTISGLIGSYIMSLSLIPILIKINIVQVEKVILSLIFVFIISSISQFGDITISYFKRKSKVKDTGKIIPGHGGLLDRIDGMLFAFPSAYLIMSNNLFNII